jgi:dienelactone hydrolase
MQVLSAPPKVYPATGYEAEGVKALFYEGLPWKGKATRVFAWYGLPESETEKKVPAVVLAHGGGGTAFDEWVRLWNARGYAAIAMDLEGHLPEGDHRDRPAHDWSGPSGKDRFQEVGAPPEDQWFFHAVADIILANSLLRSFPEIDPDRIGLTGISWGGILTGTAAGIDKRFRFAIPVYGCGFLHESPAFQNGLSAVGEEGTDRWRTLWDPSSYLSGMEMPSLWVNGSNDPFFPLSIHSKSYHLAGGERTLCVRVGMQHSHPHGWEPEEIGAFADSIVRETAPLPRISHSGQSGNEIWVEYESTSPIAKADLISATDTSDWVKCHWNAQPAAVNPANRRVNATLPEDCRAYFVNLTDDRGLLVSTVVREVNPERNAESERNCGGSP